MKAVYYSEMANFSTSYFSIEGLVGAGKSSLIKCLPALLEPEGCKVVSEPVHLYTSFMEGLYNPLEELQMDPIQSVVAGQSHIIQASTRYYDDRLFEATLARHRIVVSERSICSPYSFVETHFRMKSMSAFSKDFLNKQWLDGYGKCNTMPTSLIFIDTPPEVCYKRIRKDATRTNADHHCYSLDFLNCLRASHEKMFEIVRVPMKRVCVKDHMTPADVAFLVANFIRESLLTLTNEEEEEEEEEEEGEGQVSREITLRREK